MKRVILLAMFLFGLMLSNQWLALAQKTDNPGCRTECSVCASTCQQTLNYCLKHGGKHTQAAHIKALQDCISTCKQSADFMNRASTLQNSACALCKTACTICAESCEAFKGDKTMQACAKECRKCADLCKKMTE